MTTPSCKPSSWAVRARSPPSCTRLLLCLTLTLTPTPAPTLALTLTLTLALPLILPLTLTLHQETRGKIVPQLRDTADDIILNRDMDHPAQVENEQAFLRMQEGPNPNPNPNSNPNLSPNAYPSPSPNPDPNANPNPSPNPDQEGAAGQASRAANEKFFDARLNRDSSRTGVPPELFSEPPGRLRGTVVYAPEEARYPNPNPNPNPNPGPNPDPDPDPRPGLTLTLTLP